MLFQISSRLLLKSILADEMHFTLSIPLRVLQRQMNVPMVAIRAIAQSEDIEINSQSECISEDSLGVYADAYIRKLKAYFRRMTHNENLLLDPGEVIVFQEFCETFQKSTLNNSKVRSWDDIDEDAIRDNFTQRVLSEVSPPRKENQETLFSILSARADEVADSTATGSSRYLNPYPPNHHPPTFIEEPLALSDYNKQCWVLSRVMESSQYHNKEKIHSPLRQCRRSKSVRLIPIVSHYQIYPPEEELINF